MENAHWVGQHGGAGELGHYCLGEVKLAEIRSLWIEEWEPSDGRQKVPATLSPGVILKPMTPFFIDSLRVTVTTSWEGFYPERPPTPIHLALRPLPGRGEAPGNQTVLGPAHLV